MTESSDTWIPIFTLVLGFILKGLLDYLADQRTKSHEKLTRKEQRLIPIFINRLEFQRTHLLELQELTANLIRNTVKIYFNDQHNYRNTGNWGSPIIPESVDEEQRKLLSRILLVKVRINNKEIQNITSKFTLLCAKTTLSQNQEDAKAYLDEAQNLYEKMQTSLGDAYLTLDKDEEEYLFCNLDKNTKEIG